MAVGAVMGLWEYLYLATTVSQLATATELLLVGMGLVALEASIGALLGGLSGLFIEAAGLVAARFIHRGGRPQRALDGEPEAVSPSTRGGGKGPSPWRRRAFVVGTVAAWMLFAASLVTDALAFHRLYFWYHVALEAVAFLFGLAALFSTKGLLLLSKTELKVGRSFRFVGWGLFGVAILAGPIVGWRIVARENLRYVIHDRGLFSQKLLTLAMAFADRDGDGFAVRPLGYDCDDHDPDRHPMAWDIPGNGTDEDCSGADRSRPTNWPSPPASLPEGAPRRILIITVDAIRFDAFSTLISQGHLPILARLVQAGYLFTRAHSAASWTVPSVHSLLTGRYPCDFSWVIGTVTTDDRVVLMDPNAPFAQKTENRKKLIPVPGLDKTPTLAELLSRRGYVTATIQDTLYLKKDLGMARGFRIVVDRPYREANMDLKGITAPLMVEDALKVIRQHRDDRLFLYMHISDPHAPYRRHAGIPTTRDMWSRYLGEIRFVDRWLGWLLAHLQKENLLDDTLLVIASDHGEEFREHGGLFHGTTLYEEVLHVPLIFWGPMVRHGVSRALVSLVDVMPTILAMVDGRCGRIRGPGIDLCPLLTRGTVPSRLDDRAAYARMNRFENRLEAVLWGRYKLIRDHSVGAEVLFDLAADPKETRNVAGAKRSVLARMERSLHEVLDDSPR